jgi:hypothetical protein
MDAERHELHLIGCQMTGIEASCGTKVRHHTESGAQRALAALERKGKIQHPLEVYPCFWCHGWHLGREFTEEDWAQVIEFRDWLHTDDAEDIR